MAEIHLRGNHLSINGFSYVPIKDRNQAQTVNDSSRGGPKIVIEFVQNFTCNIMKYGVIYRGVQISIIHIYPYEWNF
jgi:hypothetical protein